MRGPSSLFSQYLREGRKGILFRVKERRTVTEKDCVFEAILDRPDERGATQEGGGRRHNNNDDGKTKPSPTGQERQVSESGLSGGDPSEGVPGARRGRRSADWDDPAGRSSL